ncbi:MAG: hypothetical protein OJF49_003222 [Ktedonobacterales bacterium]|jgi:hypothetical protein|nr:MAG: hypothetical protein OJF49_003222 [Ktedonobacterales bacterium]
MLTLIFTSDAQRQVMRCRDTCLHHPAITEADRLELPYEAERIARDHYTPQVTAKHVRAACTAMRARLHGDGDEAEADTCEPMDDRCAEPDCGQPIEYRCDGCGRHVCKTHGRWRFPTMPLPANFLCYHCLPDRPEPRPATK